MDLEWIDADWSDAIYLIENLGFPRIRYLYQVTEDAKGRFKLFDMRDQLTTSQSFPTLDEAKAMAVALARLS